MPLVISRLESVKQASRSYEYLSVFTESMQEISWILWVSRGKYKKLYSQRVWRQRVSPYVTFRAACRGAIHFVNIQGTPSWRPHPRLMRSCGIKSILQRRTIVTSLPNRRIQLPDDFRWSSNSDLLVCRVQTSTHRYSSQKPVVPSRFELLTSSFGGWRSIQLNYGTRISKIR